MTVPPIHVVTDDRTLSRPAFETQAGAVLEAGGGAVALHLRGPATSGARLWRLATTLLPVARAARAWLVVNDRVDIAAAVDADGVQLGQRSLPLPAVRALHAPPRRVGVSVHGPDEADDGADADWLLVGTIYSSGSHPARAPAGPDLLRRLARAERPPLIAIGGVVPDRVAELRRAGARGVAALGGIWGAEDPAAAVTGYLGAWHAAAPAGAEST